MILGGVIGINGRNVLTAMMHAVLDTEVATEITGGIYYRSISHLCKLKTVNENINENNERP